MTTPIILGETMYPCDAIYTEEINGQEMEIYCANPATSTLLVSTDKFQLTPIYCCDYCLEMMCERLQQDGYEICVWESE